MKEGGKLYRMEPDNAVKIRRSIDNPDFADAGACTCPPCPSALVLIFTARDRRVVQQSSQTVFSNMEGGRDALYPRP